MFRKTFQPDICDTTIPSTFGNERLNVVIFGLKTTTLIPYVLYLAKNISDTTALNKMYGILESYVMRRIVTRASTTNYTKLFLSLSPTKYLLHRIYETVCKCLAAPTPRFLMTLNFGMVLNTLN